MSKWTAMPLRQPGQPWPGTNTKGGKLDNGSGQLTQDSNNCTINAIDTLSKRKGFVRGLDKRFGTVVCGLHTYTDNCGREWLLVASDQGITIEQPFVVPVFETDDSYPSDGFDDELSTLNWRNTALYNDSGGSLLRAVGNSTSPFDPASLLRWFKPAASSGYQVQIEYAFTAGLTAQQVVSIAIKGSGDFSAGAYLQADLVFKKDSAYVATLYSIGANRTRTLRAKIDVSGSVLSPTGFLTLSYRRFLSSTLPTFVPSIDVVPFGGALQTASGSFTDFEDRDLGQMSAIGCSQDAAILVVGGSAA